MDPLITTGLITAVSSILGGLFGNRSNKRANESTYRLWKENNGYNTPAAQMERLKQAGLNPNLVYGSITTGNSSSPASYQAPTIDASSYGLNTAFTTGLDSYAKYVGTKDVQASTDLKETQIENNKQENQILYQRYLDSKLDYDIKKTNYGWSLQDRNLNLSMKNTQHDAMKLNNRAMELSNESKKLQIQEQEFQKSLQPLRKEQLEATLANTHQQLDNLRAQYSKTVAETGLTSQKSKLLAEEILIKRAEADVATRIWQAKAVLGEGATIQQQQDYINSLKDSDMKDHLIIGQRIKNRNERNKGWYDFLFFGQ